MSRLQTAPQTNTPSWALSGEAIKQATQAEREAAKVRKERRNKGFDFVQRFSLRAGETRRAIILDARIANFSIVEHEIWDKSTNRYKHFSCTKEIEGTCPLCKDNHKRSRVMFLTILELLDTPVTSKNGTVHTYFQKLLVVKESQHDQFFVFERLIENGTTGLSTTRGLEIMLARNNESTSPRSGIPQITDTGSIYLKQHSEEELLANYGSPEVKNKEGAVVKPANWTIQPIDYNAMFPKPSVAVIEAEYAQCVPSTDFSGGQSYAPMSNTTDTEDEDTEENPFSA